MTSFNVNRRTAISVCAAWAGFSASGCAPQGGPTLVLVHGAFVDSACWVEVANLLRERSARVDAVRLPLTSFADDIDAVRSAIRNIAGPVLLAGHSYGGSVISEAGNDAKVLGLVYAAALVPDAGQSSLDVEALGPPPDAPDDNVTYQDGLLTLRADRFAPDFAADVPRAIMGQVRATLRPTSLSCFQGRVQTPAWRSKRSWYLIAQQDRVLNPGLQARLARQAGAAITEVRSSHMMPIAAPAAIARTITLAARSIAQHLT